jgi:hypothetical protein
MDRVRGLGVQMRDQIMLGWNFKTGRIDRYKRPFKAPFSLAVHASVVS